MHGHSLLIRKWLKRAIDDRARLASRVVDKAADGGAKALNEVGASIVRVGRIRGKTLKGLPHGKGRRLEVVNEGILAVRHHVSGDSSRVPTLLHADFPIRPANGAHTFQRAKEGVACANIHPN
jgi:hypothetical protein